MGRALEKISSGMAVLSGVILIFAGSVMVVSVVSRSLFQRPVPGDFEIVAMATAAAVFLCLPYTQWLDGNVRVDFFLSKASKHIRTTLDAITNIAFAALALVFCWRMTLGLVDFYTYGDISQIIAIPLWWVMPFAVASFGVLSLNCIYQAVSSLRNEKQ